MIYLLSGENTYEVDQRLKKLTATFAGDVETYDGSELTIEQLPDLFLGATLFSDARLIVIKNISDNKIIWNVLAEWLEKGSANDLVLVEKVLDKRTKTYKWLQKHAEVTAVDNLDDMQRVAWLRETARARGVDIAPDMARYMCEYTGGDQWQLANDIDKLVLSGKPVTSELIRELLVANPSSSAFDLLDAALAGNGPRTNQLLDGVRAHEDPYRFFGLLSNQVFAILIIASAGDRPADTVARDSGLHPYVVRKTQPLARKLSVTRRHRLAEILATTDMQLKSSGADPWTLITTLLKTIAAG